MSEVASGTWAAMSYLPYRRLFFSSAIVVFGVMGQAVARGWLARELTGNNTGLGGVMLVFGASMLLATPLGGVAADRYSKRTVLIWSVVALMVSSAFIGVAVVADEIAYWMLLVASGIQAAAFAFYLPARIALISEVVPAQVLGNAIVVAQMSQEAMRVIAPALAGVLIGVAWFGVGGVFLLAGAASAVSAALLFGLPRGVVRGSTSRSPLAEVVDAVRYMRATPGLGVIALLTVGVVMIGFPYLTFLPTLADERFGVGAIGFGIMSGVAGLGALAAGVVDARNNRHLRPWLTIACAGVAFGVSTIALGFAPTFAVGLVALAGVGASGLVFQTSTQALMLRLSALEYHGRLQSLVILGFSGFGLAALPLGLLADATSLRLVLIGMGAVVLTMTAGFAMTRWLHRRRPSPLDIG
ncbi:MAG: MFS transporter [Ilumatobacter sp.]|nr:MAG: MFS transporter [Ilumatobacter sp.]